MSATKRGMESFSDRANRSVMNTVLFSTIVLVGLAVTAAVSVGIWNRWQTDRYSMVQDSRVAHTTGRVEQTETEITNLNNNLNALNTSLCGKIMMVNTTIQTQLDDINDELNITGVTGTSFRDNVTQELLIINMNLTDISIDIANLTSDLNTLDNEAIKTINGIPPLANNFGILSGNGGIAVSPLPNGIHINNTGVLSLIAGQGIDLSSATGDVTLSNTGVITINMMSPDASGAFIISGDSGITISSGPNLNEITVNGTALTNSITNLIMTDAVHNMELMNLTSIVNNQQMEINVLEQTLITMGQMLNGTEVDINMTLTELIMDVLMLKEQVQILENQLANASALVAPTGSMVPWAGAIGVMIPDGYLLCDGSSVAILDYPELHAQIACTYCPGMGCTFTDFCLPDLRGIIPVGEATSGTFSFPPGTPTGQENIALTSNELPSHTHTISAGGAESRHGHSVLLGSGVNYEGGTWTKSWRGSRIAGYSATGDLGLEGFKFTAANGAMDSMGNDGYYMQFGFQPGTGNSARGAIEDDHSEHVHNINSAGSGNAHTLVQPSLIITGYIIKT